LLEALCGVGNPAPEALPAANEAEAPNVSGGTSNSAVPEKDTTLTASLPPAPQNVPAAPAETLIREILELTRQADPTRGFPIDTVGGPKKPALSTKHPAPEAMCDSNNALRIIADAIGQIPVIAASAANISKPSLEQPESAMPRLEIRTLSSIPSLEQPNSEKLNLADFDVTRFEFKIEVETGSSGAPFRLLPELQPELMLRNSITAREDKAARASSDFEALTRDSTASQPVQTSPIAIAGPEAVQKVQLVFEPPPALATVRRVAMDIGDAESQVRVVIHERNGNLNVQFGAANERLRQDLQTSGPLLMRELQRDNPMPVRLDFSNFGSATEADRRSRFQWPEKKLLKPGAEFADAAETARLSSLSSIAKSI